MRDHACWSFCALTYCGLRRYDRLKYGMAGRKMQRFNHALVSIVSFLHVAPRGVKEVRFRGPVDNDPKP